MNKNIADLRAHYSLGSLRRSELETNPFDQFAKWFSQTIEAGITEPNAMVLSTATGAGKPSSRMVLLKGFDASGFSFYTNYMSRKGEELAENPQVALLFSWLGLERQVRIEGIATQIAPEIADEYFGMRPEGSRIGAWASAQSSVIASRTALEDQYKEFAGKYQGNPIPRPDHWGGYLVTPNLFEFWQGRESRLHDRFRYTLHDHAWAIERLAP
jgi:pyridoxamine 5'-phosphate oxidase